MCNIQTECQDDQDLLILTLSHPSIQPELNWLTPGSIIFF